VLNYELTDRTKQEMIRYSGDVTGLSANGYASGTVYDELCKLLMGDNVAEALRIARDTGVLGTLLPELAPMLGFDQGSKYHDMTTDEHTFEALNTAAHVEAPLRVRLALLFHDSGKPEAAWMGEDGRLHYYAKDDTEDHEVIGERIWRATCQRIGVPRRMREDVATLIRDHMVPVKTRNAGTRVRRMRVRYGDDLLQDLLLHRMCDLSGKRNKVSQNHMEHVAKLELLRREAKKDKVPASTKDLGITGRDIMAFRPAPQGDQIGEILRRVLDEVVCQPDGLRLDPTWQLGRAVDHAVQLIGHSVTVDLP
jgi:tRNA nucleotidyltransferase (CCA-adding enzyme)